MTELADDHAQHLHALVVLEALHRAGFSSVWMEDVTYFTGGRIEGGVELAHHVCRLVIDEAEVAGERYDKLVAISKEHGATLGLHELRLHQQSFSRLTLWPIVKEAA